MGLTKETRFYCDRCGVLFGTSGERGRMPPRDQIFLTMGSTRQWVDGNNYPEPLSRKYCCTYRKDDAQIGNYAAETCAQVCPRCFAEFESAQEQLKQWWAVGKKQITGASGTPKLDHRQSSKRIAAAAMVTRMRRGGG